MSINRDQLANVNREVAATLAYEMVNDLQGQHPAMQVVAVTLVFNRMSRLLEAWRVIEMDDLRGIAGNMVDDQLRHEAAPTTKHRPLTAFDDYLRNEVLR